MMDAGLRLDENHAYWVGQRRVLGVNEALQRASCGMDLSHVDPATRIAKAELGTLVHRCCAMLLQDKEPPYTEFTHSYVHGFKLFLRESNFKPMQVEKPLYHAAYEYCGTPDFWGYMYGDVNRPTIPDIKTSTQSSRSWKLQLAAYKMLIAANFHWPLHSQCMALQLKPNGTYKLFPCDDAVAEQTFLACLAEARGQGSAATRALIEGWLKR